MEENRQKFREYLDGLLSKRESVDLEFKQAKGGLPGAFWETYSSFANTEGGAIILGVKEKDGQYFPDRLEKAQVEKMLDDFWNQIHSRQKVNRCILSNNDVTIEDYNGSYLIIFDIPRASRDQKPIYTGNDPYRGTYRRDNSGDYLCPDWEVSQMFAERETELALDKGIFEHYGIEDLDQESLRAYRQMFLNRQPTHPWSGYDDKKFLIHMGAYRKDRSQNIEGITLAGLLMFGTNEILTELIPHYMIDYREYDSVTPKNRWSNRIYNDGTWEANLFQSYRRILPRLQSFLPVPFKLKGNERQDEPPSHVSVRETYVNMCIHALYQGESHLVITKYPNEIIFSNPGTLLVSKDQFYAGGKSVCRNPSLQRMFLLIGAAEKAGSGADKIMEGWRDAKFRAPMLYEKSKPNEVVMTMPLESIFSAEVQEKMQDLFGDAPSSLSREENMILATTISMHKVSNEILQHNLDLHSSDITKLLHSLCDRGMLIADGFGRGTRYVANEDFLKKVHSDNKAFPVDTDYADESLGGLFSVPDSNNQHDTNVIADINKTKNSKGVKRAINKGIKKALNRAPRGKAQIIDELMKFCVTWKKSSEMAQYVGKTPSHISSYIIPEMLARDLLEREYPETPTDSRQRYRVKRKNN